MYKVITKNDLKNKCQFDWFNTFSNPTYCFNVKMDVTNLVKFSKTNESSFFINILYLIMISLNKIKEFRTRFVKDEIRIYDLINPTFTVMKDNGVYSNAGFKMVNDYSLFYATCKKVLEKVKHQEENEVIYNPNLNYDDFYTTCIPWLSYEGMTHPLPNNDKSSLSVPRICWDKYQKKDELYFLTLNITVSHCFIDGFTLTKAFKEIQDNFNNVENICKHV